MTIQEFNDFINELRYQDDALAEEQSAGYFNSVWNLKHKIIGADWSYIANIHCDTIRNPLNEMESDGTYFAFRVYPTDVITDIEITIFGKNVYAVSYYPDVVEKINLSHIITDHISDNEIRHFIIKSDILLDKWNLEYNGRVQ